MTKTKLGYTTRTLEAGGNNSRTWRIRSYDRKRFTLSDLYYKEEWWLQGSRRWWNQDARHSGVLLEGPGGKREFWVNPDSDHDKLQDIRHYLARVISTTRGENIWSTLTHSHVSSATRVAVRETPLLQAPQEQED
jgi:hypothetical protein